MKESLYPCRILERHLSILVWEDSRSETCLAPSTPINPVLRIQKIGCIESRCISGAHILQMLSQFGSSASWSKSVIHYLQEELLGMHFHLEAKDLLQRQLKAMERIHRDQMESLELQQSMIRLLSSSDTVPGEREEIPSAAYEAKYPAGDGNLEMAGKASFENFRVRPPWQDASKDGSMWQFFKETRSRSEGLHFQEEEFVDAISSSKDPQIAQDFWVSEMDQKSLFCALLLTITMPSFLSNTMPETGLDLAILIVSLGVAIFNLASLSFMTHFSSIIRAVSPHNFHAWFLAILPARNYMETIDSAIYHLFVPMLSLIFAKRLEFLNVASRVCLALLPVALFAVINSFSGKFLNVSSRAAMYSGALSDVVIPISETSTAASSIFAAASAGEHLGWKHMLSYYADTAQSQSRATKASSQKKRRSLLVVRG